MLDINLNQLFSIMRGAGSLMRYKFRGYYFRCFFIIVHRGGYFRCIFWCYFITVEIDNLDANLEVCFFFYNGS